MFYYMGYIDSIIFIVLMNYTSIIIILLIYKLYRDES